VLLLVALTQQQLERTMLRCLLLLLLSLTADGARVKRVKAGMKYKEHDAVHIVVNKVG
jgi:hypothetical protein